MVRDFYRLCANGQRRDYLRRGNQYDEEKTEYRLEFKNWLEKLKYEHNVRMRDRNRYWLYGLLIAGGLIGLSVFYIVPKWRQTLDIKQDTTE